MGRDLFFTCEKHVGIVTLNRPQALNALSPQMIAEIFKQLQVWEYDDSVHAIVVCSDLPKAFCAGGDIRWLYDAGLSKDPKQLSFFEEEYKLNQYIHDYPKPYIALMDGVTMGGGVGISLHGSHPVATENFMFAMPETGIGFFPDIGASYLLSRCPDNFGIYLGLTGSRLNAIDAFELGLVKYLINHNDIPNIISSLIDMDLSFSASDKIDNYLQQFTKLKIESSIAPIRDFVQQSFACNTLQDIIFGLEKKDTPWHQKTLENLLKKSPLSLMVTFQQLQLAKNKTLAECLNMDACLVQNFIKGQDFYEGVRALIIDKDKSPKWSPATLASVTSKKVESYFAIL